MELGPPLFRAVGYLREDLENPTYDAYWRDQAVDKILAAQPLKVPVMLVHGLWDQEDIYGDIAVYNAIEPKDTANDRVYLVLGPWNHGQQIHDGSSLGALKFGSDTALSFAGEILAHSWPSTQTARQGETSRPSPAFETADERVDGRLKRERPVGERPTVRPDLHLRAGLRLSFDPPQPGDAPFEEYVSDPAKPVPFRARPVQRIGYESPLTWPQWLVDDQREASGRPDVAVYVSDVLQAPVKISGHPIANLVASTSGTDSDWVVKVIDVYPDEVAEDDRGELSAHRCGRNFAGRYVRAREGLADRVRADTCLCFALPTTKPRLPEGHRIWLSADELVPRTDRNRRRRHIFCQAADYRKPRQARLQCPPAWQIIDPSVVATP